jgi:hypothetical protein
MKARRQFIRKMAGLAALATIGKKVSASGKDPAQMRETAPGNFAHVVFFWLNEQTDAVRNQLLNEMKYIDKIDVIRTKHIGTPADTDRSVIDNTWSCSLVLTFDSGKEQEIYQEHPAHVAFVEKASHLWSKVLVYDSIKV